MNKQLIVFLMAFFAFFSGGVQSGAQLKPGEPNSVPLRIREGSTATAITLRVPEIGPGILKIQIRIQTAVTEVALAGPDGSSQTFKRSSLIVQSAEEMRDPQGGDLVLLPEIRDPAAGIWTVTIGHMPVRSGAGAIVTATLLRRHQLTLVKGNRGASFAGEPVILYILATDYGRPAKAFTPEIQVETPGEVRSAGASGHVSGPRLLDGSGIHEAVYIPPRAGTYRFTVTGKFLDDGRETMGTAVLEVEVLPAEAELQRVDVRRYAESGRCLRRAEFAPVLSVRSPGTYVVSLTLASDDGKHMELTDMRDISGRGEFRLALSAEQLHDKLGVASLDEIQRIDVLSFGEQGVRLVGRFSSWKITPSLVFCRH